MSATGFDVLADIIARLDGVRELGGEKFEARCPSHEDRRASLSIARAKSGGVLLFCHAGCDTEQVLRSIGMELKDLAPPGDTFNGNMKNDKKANAKPKPTAKSEKSFPTASAAIASMESRLGPRSAHWTYHEANGEPIGVVVRWDGADGTKTIRPVAKNCTGWLLKGMPEPRPLYRLPQLKGAKRVLAFEGEKCADAAAELGFVATTSPHGAQSAGKADWSSLAGIEVAVFPDHDDAGKKYAADVCKLLAKVTPRPVVRIIELGGENAGDDLVDWITRGGTAEALAAMVDEAFARQDESSDQSHDEPSSERDGRPAILLGPDEHLVTKAAVKALANASDVYQRAGSLVRVIRDSAPPSFLKRPADAPRIGGIPLPALRDILSREATWWKYFKDSDKPKRVKVCGNAVKAVDAYGYWPGIRPLEGIIETPAIRPDGTIIDAAGYDSMTGLLYVPNIEIPPLKTEPTIYDAQAAAIKLFDIVGDFNFATPAHRSAWLAALLTPFARHAFDGCVPLALIDKNVRGAGGGLLASTIGIITTGRDLTIMAAAENDAEWRKKITAIVMEGLPMVLIDNIAGRFGWPSLDAALTSTVWSDRILKENRNAKDRMTTLWYATGNNVALQADTARRCLHIRIESSQENPEERTGFEYPDLKGHIRRHRGELIRAALTILRAYFVAGRPNQQLREWGSFERWSDLIRGAIVWIGEPDPGATRRDLAKQSDTESSALTALLSAWVAAYGDGRRTAAEAIDDARKAEPNARNPESKYNALRLAILDAAPSRSGELPSVKSLGMKLHHLRRRVVDGRQFECVDKDGTKHWYVMRTGD